MTSRYPRVSVRLTDTSELLKQNQENIWNSIKPYLKKEYKEADVLPELMGIIAYAAEFTIGSVRDFGPDKKDPKWKNLKKNLRKTINALNETTAIDLDFLDAELRSHEWFKNYCNDSKGNPYSFISNHDPESNSYNERYIELKQIRSPLLHYLNEFDFLLSKSLKGKKAGERRGNDQLVDYCYKLHKVFEKRTGKKLSSNGPFERFLDECTKPFSTTTFKEYASSSAHHAIRSLKKILKEKKDANNAKE